ncbi:MAG: hypothetical protein U9Q03_03965 [Patescibacteria group bacterium]|nr:hypothetical protein [Patescibacteria group bacterium]
MRIGLDFDGTMVDHGEHKMRLAAARGFSIERWQTNTNVMKQYLPSDDYSEIKEIVYTLLTPHAPPMDGLVEHLAALEGELYLISARRSTSIRFAQEWLQGYNVYDHIPAERVFFCPSSDEKHKFVQRLGIDVYLDDKARVLESLPRQTRKVLFDSDSISGRIDLHKDIEIAADWRDFVRLMEASKAKV